MCLKDILQNISLHAQVYLELQCLVDDLHKVDMGIGNEQNSFLLHKVYIIFS